jgi:hypothetical protein
MPITEADLKLLASERMTDDADSGGMPTATVIQDNVENNIFPDIATLDRAQGAIDFRKFYAAVLSVDQDLYFGAHAILDAIPADVEVAGLLCVSSGVAEVRSELIASIATKKFYGTKKIKTSIVSGDRLVEVGSLTNHFIPTSKTPSPTSGQVALVQSGSGDTTSVSAWFPVGSARAFELMSIQFGSSFFDLPVNRMNAVSAGLTGNVTDSGGTYSIGPVTYKGRRFIDTGSTGSGVPGVVTGGYDANDQVFSGSPQHFYRGNSVAPLSATAITATYQPALIALSMPAEVYEYTYTSGDTPIINFTLPYLPEVGSERMTWEYVGGSTKVEMQSQAGHDQLYVNFDPTGLYNAQCSVNRATGAVAMLLDPPPRVGTKINFYYARAGYIASVTNPGTFASGEVNVTIAADYKFNNAFFKVGSLYYNIDSAGTVRLAPVTQAAHTLGAVVGYYNFTLNKIQVPGLAGAISEWYGIQVSTLIPVSSTGPSSSTAGAWTIPSNLDPGSIVLSGRLSPSGTAWTSSSDANGSFSDSLVTGSYDKNTGALSLTFSFSVSAVIDYTADLLVFTTTPEVVTGVNPALFPSSGEVAIFRKDDIVVLHNTVESAPMTKANGETYNTGRTSIADVRIIGNDDVEITSGWTVNRATGVVSFVNVTGWSQPIKVYDRIEVVAVAVNVTADGKITMSKEAEHSYPNSSSYLSSALVLGDLYGRVRAGFQQATWTGVWSDAIIGSAPLADAYEAIYPIAITNKGSIKERWAVIWQNTTTYNIIGEQVGQIITNHSAAATCAPLNPATGEPYFSINPLMWGAGWVAGNVYRFNTDSGTVPMWAIRSINPSPPGAQDKITVSVRGDVNA